MAGGARVWRTERGAEIGARNRDAVIAAFVNHHVRARGHVAIHAACAIRARGVEVVLRAIEGLSVVALGAQRVSLGAQPRRVRIVTMTAGDPARRHLALQERADLEHLVLDLPIDEVQPVLQQLRAPGVVHALVGRVLPQADAARVADAALIELLGLRVQPAHEVLARTRRAPACCAASTCAEPAPWQLSQPFPSSLHRLSKRPVASEKRLLKLVVWQSPHM